MRTVCELNYVRDRVFGWGFVVKCEILGSIRGILSGNEVM